MNHVLELLVKERARQEDKYGERDRMTDPLAYRRLALIMKDLGEAAQTLDAVHSAEDRDTQRMFIEHYRSEVVQAGASCIQLLQALERILAG